MPSSVDERLELKDGTVVVPDRAGLSERSRVLTTDRIEFAASV
jgi:hypothetical protein